MWPLAPAGFPGGGGEFVCEAARLGLVGSRRMRRRVLCGCWARLAFPRAREKKRKKAFGYLRVLLANNCCLPCPPERGLLAAPAWRPRRASMVSGPGAGSNAWLSRMLLLVLAVASFPVATSNTPLTCLRMLAGPAHVPDHEKPSATIGSPDPPSLKDGKPR